MKVSAFIVLGILLLPVCAFVAGTDRGISDEDRNSSLIEMRASLGEAQPEHYDMNPSDNDVEIGRQLIHDGRADLPNGKSDYISRFYACTSCHNTVREDPDLSRVDPEARLQYALKERLPYLQGSTFWGVVNRIEWYNGDYVKKYGDLVVAANKSLEASIQLCAQECSQGRELEGWEITAILAYLSTLEVKMKDLDIDEADWNRLVDEGLEKEAKLEILDEAFLPRSPATFAEPVSDRSVGYGLMGRSEMGQAVYELSCQHCHKEDGVSDLVLDDAKKTFKWLSRKIKSDSKYSIYEIIRHGTYAEYGHREYMPLYTKEKMSDQQVEDLRSFIEEKAN